MHLPKICSLRSQIFRFLHASSVSAFAHFVRDMFASLTFLCLCFRSLRSRYVRFAHFSVSVFSLTSSAICSLRSLFCVCVFLALLAIRSLRSQHLPPLLRFFFFSSCDLFIPVGVIVSAYFLNYSGYYSKAVGSVISFEL